MKDLLRTAHLTRQDFAQLLSLSEMFKTDPYGYRDYLHNDTVVLYFNKPSTRTRISMETAVARLGGVPVMVGPNELQLGRGETIEDTARVISRYARAFVIRTYSDDDVGRFAAASTIPVINALTDRFHPLQSLADVFTLRERFAERERWKLAYVGAGNNVAHSLMEAVALTGMDIALATPADYPLDDDIVTRSVAIAAETGGSVAVFRDPQDAVDNVDAVYTDVWLSMGDSEDERAAHLAKLAPYQVNAPLMARAKSTAIFMHCLPDHRGEEVTADVVDGPQSVVFDQAENRLHTAVAVLFALLEGSLEGRPGEAP